MRALVEDERGKVVREGRVAHSKGTLIEFLAGCERGSAVAVETIGNWCWIIDEIEAAGMVLAGQRTKIKNCILANLAKYGAPSGGASGPPPGRGSTSRARLDSLCGKPSSASCRASDGR